MPYTKERLHHAIEAFRVVWRQQAEREAEKARLQYRDGFNLRRKPALRTQAAKHLHGISLEKDDSDEDYDPSPSTGRRKTGCSTKEAKGKRKGCPKPGKASKKKKKRKTSRTEFSDGDYVEGELNGETLQDYCPISDIANRDAADGENTPDPIPAVSFIPATGTHDNPILLMDDDDDPFPSNNNNVHDVDKPDSDAVTSTSFAHPMAFNQTKPPCEFCSDYRFALLGHGPAKQVHATIQGHTYHESSDTDINTDGGYANSHKPTTMCRQCTHMRMMIINCHGHTFVPIFDPAPGFDRITYESNLYSRDPNRNRMLPPYIKNVCRFCTLPAMWRCDMQQARTARGEFVRVPNVPLERQLEQIYREFPQLVGTKINLLSEEKGRGCGLKLCEDCRDMLVDKFDAKIERSWKERMTKEIQRCDSKKNIRADFEFLFKDGLLWRSCCNKKTSISKWT